MGSGAIPAFIIVLPRAIRILVDHVIDQAHRRERARSGGRTREGGRAAIDAKFTHDTDAVGRARWWHLDGWHGAMQLSLNFPGIWGAIGAHSAALRPEGDAPTYSASAADFAARDPLALIKAHPTSRGQYAWWIDAGDRVPGKSNPRRST